VKRAWKIFFAISLLVGLGSCGASTVVYEDLVQKHRECADGWRSPSIGRQGACSHHGGVVTRTVDHRTASQKLLTYGLIIFGTLSLVNAIICYNSPAKPSVLLGMLLSLILVVGVIAIIDDLLVRKSSREALAQATVKAVNEVPTPTPTPVSTGVNLTPQPTKDPIDDLLESLPSPTPKASAEYEEAPIVTPSPNHAQLPSPIVAASPRLPPRYVSLVEAYDTLVPKNNQSEDTRRYRFHIEQDTRVKGSFSARGNIKVQITAAGIDPPYSSGDSISFDTIDVFLYAGTYELIVESREVVGFSVRLTAYYPQ